MKSAQNIKIIPMLLLLWGSAHVVAATRDCPDARDSTSKRQTYISSQ